MPIRMVTAAAFAVALAGSGLARADAPPPLDLPIDCSLGEDCWVVNLVDVDPGPEARDYHCGDHTYDGHKGVDIAIAGGGAMREGIAVVAAAPGTVLGTRDGMDDVDVSVTGRSAVEGRECGNGVLIDAGDGWQHQYCHLRKGSVAVSSGGSVAPGDVIGYVGMSGLAQFPHVHLTVRRDGKIIDPYTGGATGERTCGNGSLDPLWAPGIADALAEQGSVIYLSGFLDAVPEADRARAGDYGNTDMPATAPAFVLWLDMFRPDAGDVIDIRIDGPGGSLLLENRIEIDKDQARRFIYVGKKRKLASWPEGTYTASVSLTRAADGRTQRLERTIDVR